MSKCGVCKDGQVIKEGLDFYGTSVIIVFEIGICSWCMGRGYCTGD